jgi:FKBP-type peptidyl-prolyl cis-trans isomerase (trigger factor)
MLENILLTRYSQKLSSTYVVSINPTIVGELYDFLIIEKQKSFKMNGFDRGRIPLSYIKMHFKKSIESCMSEMFFSLHAQQAIVKKMRSTSSVVLTSLNPHVSIDLSKNILNFSFEIPNSYCIRENNNPIKKIKYPTRKKYKDLDKQAENLFALENNNQIHAQKEINAGDWIKIEIKIIGEYFSTELQNTLKCYVWLKISKEQIDLEMYNMFAKKKVGDSFISEHQLFHDFICSHQFVPLQMSIKIIEHIISNFFSFDKFKKYFGVKSTLDTYNKIIDVLSFRNDICLRREICQLVIKNLLDHYKIHIREDIIKIFEDEINKNIIYNPDYLLYQSSKSFHLQIKQLACKQAQEICLIDFIANQEKIVVSEDDIYVYLNIMQRPRFRNFLYFDYSALQMKQKEIPICHETIIQMVLREKVLQHCIKSLQK